MSAYIYLTDVEEANKVLADYIDPEIKNPTIAVDTETTGLCPHQNKLRLIQLAIKNKPALLIDCFKLDIHQTLVPDILKRRDILKVAHNWKFDYKFLKAAGIEVQPNLFDTYLVEMLLLYAEEGQKGQASLKALAKKYFNIAMSKEEQVSDWSGELTKKQLDYAAKDAEILLPLQKILTKKVNNIDRFDGYDKEKNPDRPMLRKVARLECDVIIAVAEMEYNGMKINVEDWTTWVEELRAETNRLEKVLLSKLKLPQTMGQPLFHYGGAGFDQYQDKINVNSTPELLKIFKDMGIPVESTEFKAIAPLAEKYPVLQDLLDYRKSYKGLTSFGQILEKINIITGRIHPNYWPVGTASGRFSCSSPNAQQMPRGERVRRMFIPAPGWMYVVADYSQIELRIVAELANEKVMIQAYKDKIDLHKRTASLVLNKPIEEVKKPDRQLAKAINFGLVYGMGAEGFQKYAENSYGVSLTLREAEKMRNAFFKAYPGLLAWHEIIKREVYDRNNRCLPSITSTVLGRLRFFPWDKAYLNPLANTPVQGTGADIMKTALLRVRQGFIDAGLTQAKIIGAVHDEIITECPENIAQEVARVQSLCMESAGAEILKIVPCVAEASIGSSWADKA